MTSGEFMEFLKEELNRTVATEPVSPLANTHKKYVYGIAGIAKLFGSSSIMGISTIWGSTTTLSDTYWKPCPQFYYIILKS